MRHGDDGKSRMRGRLEPDHEARAEVGTFEQCGERSSKTSELATGDTGGENDHESMVQTVRPDVSPDKSFEILAVISHYSATLLLCQLEDVDVRDAP
jgi:hypothetical protein